MQRYHPVLTLRISRLLTVRAMIGHFFMVTPAIKKTGLDAT